MKLRAVRGVSSPISRFARSRGLGATSVLLLGVGLGAAPTASAGGALSPARASANVEAALHDKDITFCSAPHKPLSLQARGLCPHATEIPGCEGFAAACAAMDQEKPPWWLQWLLRALRSLSGGAGGSFVDILVWIAVAGAVLAVLFPVFIALRRMRRDKEVSDVERDEDAAAASEDDATALQNADADELLQRAGTLALRGEHAAALGLYLAASLRALDKRGAVRLGRDRTNGEYVRECTDTSARGGLREIALEVDRVQFGRQPATQDALRRVRERAESIVRTLPALLPAVLILLAVTGLTGCGSASAPWAARNEANDPAGNALFFDLLGREGAAVKPLGASLVSLPPPDPIHRGPAVVVDLTRTDLDDETREHLASWTDAGGVLVLAGPPGAWPAPFHVSSETPCKSLEITAHARRARHVEHGVLASAQAVRVEGEADVVASFADKTAYAVVIRHGEGSVVGIANAELLTNAALARPGNAGVLLAILSHADRLAFDVADADDGVSPPSSPIAVLSRAGLGLGLVHALMGALILFLAVGVRLARPRPTSPPRRRAFAEHVRAVGALYARTDSASHALRAYVRFVVERVRARMPRGSTDIPAFLASRSRFPVDVCRSVWARATGAGGAARAPDDLMTLKELSTIYSSATARDK